MKIKKNNGFTLLEVLVAIFIFTTVIFIGYKIIDKSTIAVKDQGNINKGQLTMNDMNNYLTKDLEQSEMVELSFSREIKKIDSEEKYSINNQNVDKLNKEYANFVKDSSKSKLIQYTYIIKTKNDLDKTSFEDKKIVAKYRTVVEYKENKYKYTISRIDYNNIRIDFMDNETLNKSNQPPFIIKGGYPYEVSMQYNGKGNKIIKHEFSVVSRYSISSENEGDSNGGNEDQPWEPIIPIPIPPKPDEIPTLPGFATNYAAIGFWTADESKCINDNLYTWISYGDQNRGNYGKQDIEKKVFDINANLSSNDKESSNDNSGRVFAHIGDESRWRASVDLKAVKAKDIDKIRIYVKGFTTLKEFKDDGNVIQNITKMQGDGSVLGNLSNGWELYGGSDIESGTWYEAILSGNKKENFDLNGKLSIDKTQIASGYALVVYGSEDENNPTPSEYGDIVFEFNKKHKNKKDVYMKMITNVGNNKKYKEDITQNGSHNICIIVKNDDQKEIHATGVGDLQTKDEKFKDIKAIEIKLSGNLRISNFKIDGNDYSISANSSAQFILPSKPGQYRIECNTYFDELKEDTIARLIVNLKY